MEKHFNNLTPAEAERLAILLEELGEAQQAIGKILKHGYMSGYEYTQCTNKKSLEIELGHVRHAMIMLCDAGDLRKKAIHYHADQKKLNIKQYLHHN